MLRFIRLICLILLLITTPLIFSGGQRVAADDGDESARNVVKRRLTGDPRTIDPHIAGDVTSSEQCGMVYEQLFEYDYFARPAVLRPSLAAEMPKLSEDKLSLTVKLREDVYFQDDPCWGEDGKGRQMTAHDVVYSIKRLASLEETNGWWVFEGKIIGLDAFRAAYLLAGSTAETAEETVAARAEIFKQDVPGVTALDDFTVQFKLAEEYPQFLYAISMTYGAVVPREAAEYYGDTFFYNPVGTGPFKMKEWRYGLHVLWERNENYRESFFPEPPADLKAEQGISEASAYKDLVGKQLPLADAYEFRVIRETQTAWLEFLNGELDLSGMESDQFTQAVQDDNLTEGMVAKGIDLVRYDEPTIEYFSYNMKDPVVGTPAGAKGKAIRQAISLAFDREEYIKRYLNGRGSVAYNLVPAGITGYDPNYKLANCDYDPERARQVLRDAGFELRQAGSIWEAIDPDTGKQASVTVLLRNPALRPRARFFSYTGNECGVQINSEVLTFNEFLRRQDTGEGQVYHAGWVMDYPDAQNMVQLLYGKNIDGGINSANFKNSEFDAAYDEMASIWDSEEGATERKAALVRKLHDIVGEESPWTTIAFRRIYVLRHKWHSAVAPNPFNYSLFTYYTSNSSMREKMADEWRDPPFWPMAIFVVFVLSLSGLFVTRVMRQS